MSLWDDLQVHPGIPTRRRSGRGVENIDGDDPDATIGRRRHSARRAQDPPPDDENSDEHGIMRTPKERDAIAWFARLLASSPLIWLALSSAFTYVYKIDTELHETQNEVHIIRTYGSTQLQDVLRRENDFRVEWAREKTRQEGRDHQLEEIQADIKEMKALLAKRGVR